MSFVAPVLPLPAVSDWTSVASNLNAARAYLNAIPAGDVVDRSIRREHIVAPLVRGYPLDRHEGEHQVRGGHSYGIDVNPLHARSGWGARVERLAIVPRYVDGTWRLSIGWTLYVPLTWTTRQLEAVAHGSANVRADPFLAALLYPNGTGGGASAGRLRWTLYDRTDRTETVQEEGACDLYPQDVFVQEEFRNDPWRVVFVGDVLGGRTYDLVLTYVRGSAPDGIDQIDLSEVTATFALS